MATKVFVVLSSADREVALEVGLVYPLNAAKNKWMDEVKVIFFGPSEKVAAYDLEVQQRIRELHEAGVDVMAWNYSGRCRTDNISINKGWLGFADILKYGLECISHP